MFGFGKTTRDPFADAKAPERWLASFPANDPLALHGELLAELGRIAERDARRTPAQLEALFALDAQTAELRRALAAQYIEHASRSSRIEQQLWSAQFDLAQAFLLAYQAFAREISLHGGSGKWQAMLPELVARQVIQLGEDARIRLYRYEQWIPAKWAEFHGLFALASSREFERTPLALAADGATTTIEHQYLLVLVLQLANAGNLTARHLDWVWHELNEWCAPLHFALESSSLSAFYVDLASREGLKRRTPAPLEGRVLFLDTRPLHAVLLQHILVLEQKLKQQPLSERTPKRTEQLNLLVKLAAQVDPEFRPFARRGERTAAAGTVDAIVGFQNIAAFLREEERSPLPGGDGGNSFGGTMELAVFGRMRNEADRALELARRRLAAHAAPGGPWEVKDVSQTGFRMIAAMAAASSVTLGSLAALRPHGDAQWTLGVVRRMKRLTTDRAEIGLQVIATAVTGVELIEQRKALDTDYAVDGGAPTVNGRTFPGLLLVLKRRNGDGSVQSLVLPAVEYQPTRKLKLATPASILPVRLGRLLEQQPDWVWTAVETVEQGATLPTAPVHS